MPVKKSAAKAKAPAASEDCCAKCDQKIADLESKIAGLESKLKGLLEGIEAASKLKGELDEAKLKLGAEVSELKENAKSWAQKTKESMDTNKNGKIDFEEIYSYCARRMSSRNPAPKK